MWLLAGSQGWMLKLESCLLVANGKHKKRNLSPIKDTPLRSYLCETLHISLGKPLSYLAISSVQFSLSVVSDSLRPHELQHARPACPSSAPGVHSNSRPSSRWCHPAISSSVVPFSPCPQSLPASVSFQWVNSSHEVAKVLEEWGSFTETETCTLFQQIFQASALFFGNDWKIEGNYLLL